MSSSDLNFLRAFISKACTSCCTLRTVIKFFGIFDFFCGVLSIIVMIYRFKEGKKLHLNADYVVQHGVYFGTFPALIPLPLEFFIPSTICYVMQFNLGAILFCGSLNDNLSVVFVCCWIVITFASAPFTGLFIRTYQIVFMCIGLLQDQTEPNSVGHRSSSRRHRNQNAPHPSSNPDESPPNYDEVSNSEADSTEDIPPPTYAEAMEKTLRWIYGRRWMMKSSSSQEPDRFKKFSA